MAKSLTSTFKRTLLMATLPAMCPACCGDAGQRRQEAPTVTSQQTTRPATRPALALGDIRKVLAVSDSLTNDGPDNWLALLGQRLRVETVANAHGGWTTRSFFKEKFKDVAFAKVPPDADLLILLLGSNNLFEDAGGSDASVAEVVEGVQRLAEHVLTKSPRARVMLVAPPTVALKNNKLTDPKAQRRIDAHTPAALAKLSTAYRELADRRGWLFADLYPVLVEDDFVDAAHPGPAGNRKMADAIAAALTAAAAGQ